MVTKLIASYRKVTTCRRETNETFSNFASLFRGLGAKNLLHLNASTSSQIAAVHSIALLNNPALDEGTLINAKLQLVSLAEPRAKGQSHDVEMV